MRPAVWTPQPTHCVCGHETQTHRPHWKAGMVWGLSGCRVCQCGMYELDVAAVEEWREQWRNL